MIITGKRIDLFEKIPFLKGFAKWRSFQFLMILPNLLLFYLFLIAGLFGSPVGNRNSLIVFIWILWWFMLITFMVPFASRIWCIVCPLPFFGEWLQRGGALIRVLPGKTAGLHNKLFGLNQRWPRRLSNIWTQNFGFLFLCTFSAMLVTRPIVTVLVLGGLIVIALVLSAIYRLRTFCMYLCPVSGFLSLYAMTSMIELRSKNQEVCQKCREKSCVAGNEKGWACPWFAYMGKLDRNNYCGLCMECVKSCPNDNISLFARPFAADNRLKGYDEAWKAFIMLMLALAYSVTLLSPWGTVKDWANVSETGNWGGFALYAGALWLAATVVLPALFYLTVRAARALAGKNGVPMKQVFLGYGYTLVPLGLLAWIAFSLPLIMVNGSYLISAVSDPLGRGWDLLGTAHFPWTPFLPEWCVHLQVLILAFGLYVSLKAGFRAGAELFGERGAVLRSMVPVSALLLGVTVVFMKLFTG